MTRALICCALFLLSACSGGDAPENLTANGSNVNETEDTSRSTAGSKNVRRTMKPINLNDGMPWKADKEMIQRVSAMLEIVEENRTAEQIDRAAVVRALEHHTSKFIASCTMKGQGHEELHKWLEPYMRLIKELDKAQSDAEMKEMMDEMSLMLKSFGEYFE